ncbi:MAG TPA: TIGR03557 family F420-dependent LLM class oxidoreductase [Acidimicrobiales bacterium]
MTEVAFFLSSEELDAPTMVATAGEAEAAGFEHVWVSDHYHPWVDAQGESPFVWAVVGGIGATTQLTVTTAVTCPTMRIHPAIVAQAAATASTLLPGRFRLGVGSGEALNEHILGDRWPPTDLRLSRLAEAVDVMRKLWTGETVTHRGEHYTVENARIYSGPAAEIPVPVSAFGPKALEVAISHGDAWMTSGPDTELLGTWRQRGSGPALAMVKVCWGPDEAKARRLAHERWPTSGLGGELSQELATPAHFEQASANVTEEDVAGKIACGPDPERHLAALQPYLDAGFDEIAIAQVGPDQRGFLDFWVRELRPRLGI